MYDCKHYSIPEHLVDGLIQYGKHGIRTGSFLHAVLCDCLSEAIAKADPHSLAAIHDLVLFVHNEMPVGSHGSPEKVETWMQTFAD